MSKKYFTLEEANKLLPEVITELEALQDIKHKFESKYTELQQLKKQSNQEDQFFSMECEMEFLQIQASTHMNNIQSKGIELRDIELGLIDFPSLSDGEEILLCWKLGEPNIHYYHGVHEGFNARKQIGN